MPAPAGGGVVEALKGAQVDQGRDAGARYVSSFVKEMKASGFFAAALARHGIQGAAVAPSGR
jgi:polar amino acid transport system substrate-binding protein